MDVLYITHPTFLRHDPRAWSPDHPDDPARLEAIGSAMAGAGLDPLRRLAAPAASEADLTLVHSAAHVAFIRELCAAGGGRVDDDTFVGEMSYEAALHAAGGACAMVRALVGGEAPAGFCAVRPAGHHADRDRAMGFCLFNNVAIAAELAIRTLGAERVMIIDWDVHHGNGTAEIFRRRADVLVADIHQSGLFPGTGAIADAGSADGHGYTVNLPVPRWSGEEVWLSLLEHIVVPIGLEYRPQLVLVSAGFDAHADDPLGGCVLDAGSFGQMTCHVRDFARACDAPLGVVLEGGYAGAALGDSVVETIAALQGRGEADSAAADPIVTPQAASHLGHRWVL